MVLSFVLLSLLVVAGTAYIGSTTEAMRKSSRNLAEVQSTNLCEAGVQDVLRVLWKPFKQSQNFTDLDTDLTGAQEASPRATRTGTIGGVGAFSVGVIKYQMPSNFSRIVTVRAVGWQDTNQNAVLDAWESSKTIDVTARFELERSQVFDYTYFINNYGWMDGFGPNNLYVNGDMRSNANFNFLNGSPTVNGSVYAALNDKLTPRAVGVLNTHPVKMENSTYASFAPANPPKLSGESNSAYAARIAAFQLTYASRRRQAYSSGTHGAAGSSAFEENRDFVFESTGAIQSDRVFGAVAADSSGVKKWSRTSVGQTSAATVLDSNATKEVVMPDLNDLSTYMALSQSFVDTNSHFQGGAVANPNHGRGAYVEVYNAATGNYQRLDTNGVITGSAVLVGTADKPIRIHGPVTVTQDVVIKGFVEGQGTLYSGRNTHIVGSIKYKNGPDFRGANPQATEAQNASKDFLGLAARGSIVMGNPNTFTSTNPLAYMTPINPPTKNVGTYGRYDENGNWIPPYNANETDSTGKKRYQSVISNTTMNAIAEGVNQIDAVMYSNFVGGGNVGTSGGGLMINGTIISRDEAIVTWSLPLVMNYDTRIRERAVSNNPLIDLNLPRSPVLLRSTWQDRGFYSGAPMAN